MCWFSPLGCRVEASGGLHAAPDHVKPRRLCLGPKGCGPHDSPRTPDVHMSGPPPLQAMAQIGQALAGGQSWPKSAWPDQNRPKLAKLKVVAKVGLAVAKVGLAVAKVGLAKVGRGQSRSGQSRSWPT